MAEAKLTQELKELERKAEDSFLSVGRALVELAKQHTKKAVMQELNAFPMLRNLKGVVDGLPNTAKDDAAMVTAITRGFTPSSRGSN